MKIKALVRKFLVCSLLVAAIACDNEKDPAVINRSVRPPDFLSANDYKSITVEIVYVEGFQPTASTVQNLKVFLAARLNKPTGINVVQHAVLSPGTSVVTVDQLRDLEFKHRTENTEDANITAYFYFADGEYSGSNSNSKTLGIAYDYSSMAIFEESLRKFSGSAGTPSVTTLETTVIFHEFAHLLGLVNNGTPMQERHQDAAHEGHCSNQDCLMYYLAETSGIAPNLFGGSVPNLDANCLADLKANGGK